MLPRPRWFVMSLLALALAGADVTAQTPTEAPRQTPVGVLIHRVVADDVEALWRGNPGGNEACNVIHNGYGGILDRTVALLEMCAERTGDRMRVIVRPNAEDIGAYVTALLRSPHANLILGWYIVDEPFAYPWNADDIPRPGETKGEFWLRYRNEHAGKPPWPAQVSQDRKLASELTSEELASIEFRGGDDLFWVLKQRDAIRAAEAAMASGATCRNEAVRKGERLPLFADYGSLCATYGLVDGRIEVRSPQDKRLGYWWYDDERRAATWRKNGSVEWRGETVWRRFGAFGEDMVIDNWFSSPCDADGTPRPRSKNRIDGAFALIREDAPDKPVWFFLGYGQSAALTRRNMELAEVEGPVAGYLLWSWGLSNSIHEAWLGSDPNRHWAAMIEALR